MEENNNNNNEKEFSVDIDKEDLKKQTKDTVNQVKESFKNTNFKDEANKTKGFVLKMISSPFSTIQEVVSEKENYFSNAVMLVVAYLAIILVEYIAYIFVNDSKFVFKSLFMDLFNPLCFIIVVAGSTYVFGGKNKKSLTTVLTGIAVSRIPVILSEIVSIIEIIVLRVIRGFRNLSVALGYIFTSVENALSFLSTALLFLAIFGVISQEDDDKKFRKIAVIMLVAYFVKSVFSFILK